VQGLLIHYAAGREKIDRSSACEREETAPSAVPIRAIHDRWINKYSEHRLSALAALKTELENKE
jgi:hypothetical protein